MGHDLYEDILPIHMNDMTSGAMARTGDATLVGHAPSPDLRTGHR